MGKIPLYCSIIRDGIIAIDTTGAGHLFICDLTAALLQSNDLQNAVLFADRAGCFKVTGKGTQSNITLF